MKLGVFNPIFQDRSFEEALDSIGRLGLEAIEIGCGNYPGDKHCQPKRLVSDSNALADFKTSIERRGLVISALSCHGNPLHPSESLSRAHIEVQHDAIRLAGKLGVERVVVFSGCPGDSPDAKYPNWVTSPWPEDYPKVLEWQWRERVIPFWQEEAKFARENGVEKICVEMHPGFVVYNPETLGRLREAVGEKIIGANFDPSHMFWQGIDPCMAIKRLGSSIYHFHAKDTHIDREKTSVDGVLDPKSYANLSERSWYFRTVGYGHDLLVWREMISALRIVGYDHVVSIEHEDALMSRDEGLKKAVEFLRSALIVEAPSEAWWT